MVHVKESNINNNNPLKRNTVPFFSLYSVNKQANCFFHFFSSNHTRTHAHMLTTIISIVWVHCDQRHVYWQSLKWYYSSWIGIFFCSYSVEVVIWPLTKRLIATVATAAATTVVVEHLFSIFDIKQSNMRIYGTKSCLSFKKFIGFRTCFREKLRHHYYSFIALDNFDEIGFCWCRKPFW